LCNNINITQVLLKVKTYFCLDKNNTMYYNSAIAVPASLLHRCKMLKYLWCLSGRRCLDRKRK
jgi:hypothetical protein